MPFVHSLKFLNRHTCVLTRWLLGFLMLLQQLGQPAPTFLPLPRPWRDLITIALHAWRTRLGPLLNGFKDLSNLEPPLPQTPRIFRQGDPPWAGFRQHGGKTQFIGEQ